VWERLWVITHRTHPDNGTEECWRKLNRALGNRLFGNLDKLQDAALSALDDLEPPQLSTYLCPWSWVLWLYCILAYETGLINRSCRLHPLKPRALALLSVDCGCLNTQNYQHDESLLGYIEGVSDPFNKISESSPIIISNTTSTRYIRQ
jgi:hypothetical protein